jgi:hypothetical protein
LGVGTVVVIAGGAAAFFLKWHIGAK